MRLPAILLVAILTVATSAPAQSPIVTTDLLKIRTVTDLDVSPDGSMAVLAVRSIAAEPSDGDDDDDRPSWSYRSHLVLLNLFGPSDPRQLTHGKRMDGGPQFSPDGRHIAFVRADADDPDEGEAQVWVLPVDGGEARQVSSLEHGVSGPCRWSPDGQRILVGSDIPMDDLDGTPPFPTERPQRTWDDAGDAQPKPDGTRSQIRAWLAENADEEDPAVITRLDFQEELTLAGPMTVRHLFLLDADPAPEADHEAVQLTSGFFGYYTPEFMPDGQSILYTTRKQTEQHPDRVLGTDVWAIDVDGGNDRELLKLDGWSIERALPSPDGAFVGFTAHQLDEPAFRQWALGVAAAEGIEAGEPAMLTRPDLSAWSFRWSPAAPGSLLFVTALHGGFPLMGASLGTIDPVPVLQRLDDHRVGVHAFDVGGPSTVCAVTTPANPCVVIVRNSQGQRVAWDPNTWVADRALSMPVESWLDRPDGSRVQYWVMEPTDRRVGREYPVCVAIHGGPSAMWGPGERTMWHEFQLLCSWGYGVAYCNPRGSGGYGYEFQRGNFQDWGTGPAGDVLAVASEVTLTDWVDDDKLVVTGGSYAGYLTAWIVAHDQRFKAAVAQRGVYDLSTFFGEGNAWRLVEWAMGVNPIDARGREILDDNSPFTFVSRIRTPLLIMHASQDLRTGVSQSEMLYRALKVLDRPVEYVRYPSAGHDLSRSGDPRQRMDRLNRIIEFFERHVENERPAPRRN